MHYEILVEEPSAEAALLHLVPKILPGVSHKIYPHQGKQHLLRVLPNRLRGYARWLPPEEVIVVVIDADRDDCLALKRRLEQIAAAAGLKTRSGTGKGRIQVLNRIAIEELEAWFFGDMEALCTAFRGVPRGLAERAAYRDPDAIKGGTWEALERELQRAGHHLGGLAKIEAARSISRWMDPDRNRSRSFQAFRSGLQSLSMDIGR
jgi:hypothetical protein